MKLPNTKVFCTEKFAMPLKKITTLTEEPTLGKKVGLTGAMAVLEGSTLTG